MLIGVDFDNTIVSYDALFHRIALERGLIPASVPVNKTAVRDHLRSVGAEDAWTEMQGEVYGARMAEAEPFPGVREFFRACREKGIDIAIVSHKTRHPFRGPAHDLHAAARSWMRQHGFFEPTQAALSENAVWFELTKAEKIARIAALRCTHFIDDLPEILTDPAFPVGVERFLFDPSAAGQAIPDGIRSIETWTALRDSLLGPEAWLRAAIRILSSAGSTIVGQPEPLAGGANNRVFRVAVRDAGSVVVKRYFRRESDGRDRFGAEKAFYDFAWAAGATQIPSVVGWDERDQLGVFSHIDGSRSPVADAWHLDEALRFFRTLNRHRHLAEARSLPDASEACFALDTHLATVRRRVASLSDLPREDALDESAARFIQEVLSPTLDALTSNGNLERALAGDDPARVLDPDERCVSPSDFGFHNSLLTTERRLVFFDFEYAGWDDPAKLVCDFFCQPDIPAPRSELDRFINDVADILTLRDPDRFARRCHTLLPLYQIKWACILLNEFTPAGRARRTFALGASAACARRSRQLVRARAMLASPRLAA